MISKRRQLCKWRLFGILKEKVENGEQVNDSKVTKLFKR